MVVQHIADLNLGVAVPVQPLSVLGAAISSRSWRHSHSAIDPLKTQQCFARAQVVAYNGAEGVVMYAYGAGKERHLFNQTLHIDVSRKIIQTAEKHGLLVQYHTGEHVPTLLIISKQIGPSQKSASLALERRG